ncbi:MAG: ArnT family glycosyltransferase, partial [Caulobacteraceae bacterium]
TGLIVHAMAALGRIYGAAKGEPIRDGWTAKAAFWLGFAGAVIVKGPVAPMMVGFTLAALLAWDRKIGWLRHIGWGWGLALTLLIVGPWAWAITVTTDGSFFTDALSGDILSKLHHEGQEGHGAPPGLHLLLTPLLSFPATFLLPAGLVYGWQNREKTGVRFALCWLVPSWIAFELAPTKLPHYVLPMYGALAWLIAGALSEAIGRRARYGGALLGMIVAGALSVGVIYAARLYGGGAALGWSIVAAVLMTGAGLAGALLLLRRHAETALLVALALGIAAHGAAAVAALNLTPLWVAKRMSETLARAGLDPRNGLTPGPVAVSGIEEPSVVFMLGTNTEFTDVEGAAQAASQGRPVFVDRRHSRLFLAALDRLRVRALPAGEVKGINYSKGEPVDLILYRSLIAPPDAADEESH